LLAYADLADATGRVLQPDPHVLATRSDLRVASVRSLTRALLDRGLLTCWSDHAADAWGFRVTVEGREGA
jgi:hypothetical protein